MYVKEATCCEENFDEVAFILKVMAAYLFPSSSCI